MVLFSLQAPLPTPFSLLFPILFAKWHFSILEIPKIQFTTFPHVFCTSYDLFVLFLDVCRLFGLSNRSLSSNINLNEFLQCLFQPHCWAVVRIFTIAPEEVIRSLVCTMRHSMFITLFQSQELQGLRELETGQVYQVLCAYIAVAPAVLLPWYLSWQFNGNAIFCQNVDCINHICFHSFVAKWLTTGYVDDASYTRSSSHLKRSCFLCQGRCPIRPKRSNFQCSHFY